MIDPIFMSAVSSQPIEAMAGSAGYVAGCQTRVPTGLGRLMRDPVAAQGYQVGPHVLTKLPPFQLSAEGDLRNGARGPAGLCDMGLLAVYGRVYAYLVRRAALGVSLFRFYKWVTCDCRSCLWHQLCVTAPVQRLLPDMTRQQTYNLRSCAASQRLRWSCTTHGWPTSKTTVHAPHGKCSASHLSRP